MRCWRFAAAARREEGEYPSWIFDRRATRLQRQRSATLRAKFWRAAGGVAPQSQSALALLLRRALPAARQNLAHSFPIYEMGSTEQDIRSGHIKFYWAGSIASRPVGVPIEVAKKYPQANAGIGCVTNDIPLRERQEEYARRYNEKMYAYITQKH